MFENKRNILREEENHDFNIVSPNVDVNFISLESGGFIVANNHVFQNIPKSDLSKYVLKESVKGTPLFKFGSGDPNEPTVMIVSGIHGNEIPPQIASVYLINKLKQTKLNGTVYVIPFSAPKSTMDNSRWFNSMDLNRSANKEGSISNLILKKIQELKVDSVGDFHSTAPNANPGREGIFCALEPSYESYTIGEHISKYVGSEVISYEKAGSAYKGALEDECNMLGIPAVTCEVLSPNGYADELSFTRSFAQMISYLEYFNII
ncbi:succinylglutamate desuccinylase/aspartoacylase family protein [Methanobrevibacter filiformis]|uniref:Succinylglutamate desuccinylase / aspartoacylase family protein n=1 Tax=Methanobrevibacter filiformis TaxID=55758 RepID=A0A166C004_9EURY|nr:succinylglutamate desuccinylase/aspartoacylase family protein [Methanobrevibacter filiformis]KZX13988.1 succinylglutamate desuccinylase / aspartoacylase family protein [Methanobrevibacter filiformis]